MKEIDFPEFRVKCSAIIEQVRKTRQPIRVTRLGKPLAEIVPLSSATNESGPKRLRKKSPRVKSLPRALKRGYICDDLTARLNVVPFPILSAPSIPQLSVQHLHLHLLDRHLLHHDILARLIIAPARNFGNLRDYILPFDYLAEDCVLAREPRGGSDGDEEL
jgi:prevent-host-death family protein